MNPLLVVILGILAGVGTAVSIVVLMDRREARAIERTEQAERRARLQRTLVSLELGICAIHGHRYLPTFIDQDVQVWRCGACGDERGYFNGEDGVYEPRTDRW